jgi:selenophosphate synthetase-related protein
MTALGDHLKNEASRQTLANVLWVLRQFKGITRKSVLGDFFTILEESMFDDAGLLKVKDAQIVVSTDGIVEDLVNDDPWLAGFYSVVVNVNDVVAKGAVPLGYTGVISSNSMEILKKMVEGVKFGLDKYHLKFLKGHTHPDTSYNAIDATVIGLAETTFLSSATAKAGDELVLAIDLDGKSGLKGWVKIFDSVMSKSSDEVFKRLNAVIDVAQKKLATASRDISGPGIVGTVAMLCESSRVGAKIDLDRIPKPESIELVNWLTTYPALGFVFATKKTEECSTLLKKQGFTTEVIGEILKETVIRVSYHGQTKTFLDLSKDSIFGKNSLMKRER